MTPPLVVDIDGTLTDDERVLDPRVLGLLGEWPSPVVVATGKALPYAVALCEFAGIDRTVVAENGGVAFVDRTDDLLYPGDPPGVEAVRDRYREAGHEPGWGDHDLVNRWRETELVVDRESPLEPLERVAAEHGFEVVDTGFAYHVKSPDVSKGRALETVADRLGRDPGAFVAIGDSANDVSTFEVAGWSFAVANADDAARAAADVVVSGTGADGFLDALDRIERGD